MSWLNFLQQVDIFEDLKPAHLEKLAGVCRLVEYHQGEVIVRENTPSNEIFLILSGDVDIVLDPEILGKESGHKPKTVTTLRQGQTFGEIGLVDRGLRSATALAATAETRLLTVRREDLLKLCEGDHELGYILMRNIASDLAFKIRNTDLMVREQLLWKAGSAARS